MELPLRKAIFVYVVGLALLFENNCSGLSIEVAGLTGEIVEHDEVTTSKISTLDSKELVQDEIPTSENVIATGDAASESTICDPNLATFEKCSRTAIPEDNVVVDSKSEVNGQIDPHVIRLIKESNLTIGDSIANHKIVLGRASCKCGISSRRIVGGQTAAIRELPWTVALTRSWGGRAFCGGTLINSQYVLTASHCVDGQSASGITVLINEQDMNSNFEAITQKIAVAKITMHSNYNRRNIDNDIALLRLARAVDITTGPVVPACLPASNSNTFAGVTATVAGWGATNQGSSTSSVLRKVDVPVISNSDCNTKTKYNNKITENMLCAGFVDSGGKDSCQGDSGGPLVINNGGRKTLIGIVSWGYGCAQPQSPGVYTRVSNYPRWILDNTRDANWCEG